VERDLPWQYILIIYLFLKSVLACLRLLDIKRPIKQENHVKCISICISICKMYFYMHTIMRKTNSWPDGESGLLVLICNESITQIITKVILTEISRWETKIREIFLNKKFPRFFFTITPYERDRTRETFSIGDIIRDTNSNVLLIVEIRGTYCWDSYLLILSF
jgi:hypothetical protein